MFKYFRCPHDNAISRIDIDSIFNVGCILCGKHHNNMREATPEEVKHHVKKLRIMTRKRTLIWNSEGTKILGHSFDDGTVEMFDDNSLL